MRTSLLAGAIIVPSNWARMTGNGGSSASALTSRLLIRCFLQITAFDLDEIRSLGQNLSIAFAIAGSIFKCKGDRRAAFQQRLLAAADRPARRQLCPSVFLTTWNSPPASRIFARSSSISFMVRPMIFGQHTSPGFASSNRHIEQPALPCVSLRSPMLFHLLSNKKSLPRRIAWQRLSAQ